MTRYSEERKQAVRSGFHFLDETERVGCDWLAPAPTRPAVIQLNGLALDGSQQRLAAVPLVFPTQSPADQHIRNLVFLGRLNVIKRLELQREVLADCLAAGLPIRLRLLQAPPAASAIREAGLAYARRSLDWQPLAGQMIDFYQTLLERPSACAG